jgi:hypothetical protein
MLASRLAVVVQSAQKIMEMPGMNCYGSLA